MFFFFTKVKSLEKKKVFNFPKSSISLMYLDGNTTYIACRPDVLFPILLAMLHKTSNYKAKKYPNTQGTYCFMR